MSPRAQTTPDGGAAGHASLLSAMTATVADRGYRQTSVADVLGRAGVARSTFYAHYASKERCFNDAVAEILADAVQAVREVVPQLGAPEERMRAPLAALLELVAARPDAARVALIETHAAGAESDEQRRAANDALAGVLRRSLGPGGADGALSAAVPLAICGGVESVMVRHIREGRAAELPALAAPLSAWAVRYCPLMAADAPLLPQASRPPATPRGGRAPGSLAPVAPSGRRGLPPGPKREPRDAIAQSLRNRLLDATTSIVAEQGYGALTVATIVARAATSRRSFYEHFGSIADAFAQAMRRGAEAAAATTLMAYAAPRDPAVGVVAGLEALSAFLVDEPAFATAGLGSAPSAGVAAFEVRDEAINAFAAVLADGHRRIGAPAGLDPHFVAAVTAGGILMVCSEEVRRGRLAHLPALVPALSAVALAPVLAPEPIVAALEDAAGPP